MKIRIIDDTVAQKRPVKIGEILEVDANEGLLLIGLKKAEKVENIAQEENSPEAPASIPPVEKPDEKPKKKKKE